MKVLLVEDSDETSAFVCRGLQESGDEVLSATSGTQGLEFALSQDFDVIILDRMLPNLGGMSVLQQLRSQGNQTPIIMLTAMAGIDDRVEGLNAGADDYVVKPFAFSELYARLHAQVRRKTVDSTKMQLQVGDLVLDRTLHEATRQGQSIALLPREYRILELLMQNEGQVVTRKMLLEQVWGYNFDPKTSLVQTHVSRLRVRIDKPFDQELISTVRGEGYVLKTE